MIKKDDSFVVGGSIIKQILSTTILDKLLTDCIKINYLNENFAESVAHATATLSNFCIDEQCKKYISEKMNITDLLQIALDLAVKLPTFPSDLPSYEEICYNCFIVLSAVASQSLVHQFFFQIFCK